MVRQGDVLLVPVKKIPKNCRPVEREHGSVVLAHGEATGHHHSFSESGVALLESPDEAEDRFLMVEEPSVLRHQEHGDSLVGKGKYRVIRQQEYSPEAIRNVAD